MPSVATDKCFLCGATENLTRDHIPPKGLFPKPRPSNLYTVTCCEPCNNGASQEDEYFRVAASCLINAHPTGKGSFERVVESTLPSRRIAKQIAKLRANVEPVTLRTPDGDIEARRHLFDASMICRVLVRITKGFLAASHPELDTSNLDFEITHIDQFRTNSLAESGITEHFTQWGAGNGVYEQYRAASAEDYGRGMMVHVFYGAAVWMVRYQPGIGLMTSSQHPGWSESAPGSPADIKNSLNKYKS